MTCGPSQQPLPSHTRTLGPTITWATVTRPQSTCGGWLYPAGAARLTTRNPSHRISLRPQPPPPPSPLTGATDRGVRCPRLHRLPVTITKASKGISTRATIATMHFPRSPAKTSKYAYIHPLYTPTFGLYNTYLHGSSNLCNIPGNGRRDLIGNAIVLAEANPYVPLWMR